MSSSHLLMSIKIQTSFKYSFKSLRSTDEICYIPERFYLFIYLLVLCMQYFRRAVKLDHVVIARE